MAGRIERITVAGRSSRRPGWNRIAIILLTGLVLVFLAIRHAFAGDIYVLGDSIGEDIGRVAKQKTLAKVSVSIANHWIYRQLPNVPPASTVVMALGTNDADNTGGVGHLGKHIDAILAAAKAADLKLYWLGPVCVRTGSDARSAALDKILAEKLASTPVTYVSMRRPALCDPTLHARDGQHFRDAGSRLIWQEVTRVAGFDRDGTALVEAHPNAVARPDALAPQPLPIPQPIPVATAPVIPPATITPAHAASQAKVPVVAGTVPSASLVTGSIEKSQITGVAAAANTSVSPQISLEVLPLGLPRSATAKTAAPASAPPAPRTSQLIDAAPRTTPPETSPSFTVPPEAPARPKVTHAPPEANPAKPNNCFFGLFSC